MKIHSTKRKRVGALEAHAAPDGTISYRGRLLLADGSRSPRFALTAGLTEAEARHEVAKFQAQEDATGQVLAAMRDRAREKAAKALAPHDLETADAWFARYLPTKECGAGHRRTTRQWWAMWISPVLGAKPVASLTRDDLEDVRDALDVAIAEGRIRSASARNIWSILTSAMKAASAAKDRSLRVHAAPLHFGILPPKRTASRQRPWLFPREWSALASCEAIPLVERQVFAIALYTGLRPGELWALTWGDVDLESRTLSVSKATDDESDDAKAPKTAEGQRIVPIHPNLLPLLAAMKGAPAALVVPRVVQNMGKRFRARLAEAGITRPRLTASTPTEEPADFRTLRDSYATGLAILGTSTDVVKRRMGHRDLATTERYIKAAEAFDADGVGEPFPPLPAGLLLPSAGGPFQDPFQGAPEGAGFPRNLGSDCRTRIDPTAGIRSVSAPADTCTPQTPAENPNDRTRDGSKIGSKIGGADSAELDSRSLAPDAAEGGREGLIAELARRVAGLALAGDAKALAVATDALQRLVEAPGGTKAPVVDLASRRSPRGSR